MIMMRCGLLMNELNELKSLGDDDIYLSHVTFIIDS